MAQELPSPEPGAGLWNDILWNDLLTFIEERAVIPILGADLLDVDVGGTPVRLEKIIATRLAERLGLPPEEAAAEPSLNDVACRFLRDPRNKRQTLYINLGQVVRELKVEAPRPLRQLAQITHCNLFVTTTFDPLLADALAAVAGRPAPRVLGYAPKKIIEDLPSPKEALRQPVVYHLFGRPDGSRPYVVSEEDLLEFVCALQTGPRPEKLFDALKNNHLLVLGCNFSDWLARFFLRATKQDPLSESRDVLEFLADSHMYRDRGLVLFLRHFTSQTKVFQGGAAEFVQELWRRWQERNPAGGAAPPEEAPARAAGDGRFIFISYLHEDRAAVEILVAGLKRAGLACWYDEERLGHGAKYNPLIARNINECACFLAVLSRSAAARDEGYFFQEWDLAQARERRMRSDRQFIVPVVVDDAQHFPGLQHRDRPVEAELTLRPLPGGRVTDEFVARLRQLVGGS
jgi:hypothetical protein